MTISNIKRPRQFLSQSLYKCILYGSDQKLLGTFVIRETSSARATEMAIMKAKANKLVNNSFNPEFAYKLIKGLKFGGSLFSLKIQDKSYVVEEKVAVD